MRLRTRLLVLSVSTVAVIVAALFVLHLDSLTKDMDRFRSGAQHGGGKAHSVRHRASYRG